MNRDCRVDAIALVCAGQSTTVNILRRRPRASEQAAAPEIELSDFVRGNEKRERMKAQNIASPV